jgi:hypothetical protein
MEIPRSVYHTAERAGRGRRSRLKLHGHGRTYGDGRPLSIIGSLTISGLQPRGFTQAQTDIILPIFVSDIDWRLQHNLGGAVSARLC